MEDKLYREYRSYWQKGVKVKGWWFKTRAKQLLQATEAGSQFKFSNAWFAGFKRRYNISLRRPTNKAQNVPTTKKQLIQNFHRKICQEAAVGPQIGKLGQFNTSNVANVDQTPLPFTFTDGPTYDDKGVKTVWVQGGSSGLDKRQCTVQLTLFADGIPRVKPLLIFRGTGKRISLREQLKYDRRVGVKFQAKAWCDEPCMKHWIRNHWKRNVSGKMMLLLDHHKAQKTPSVLTMLKDECDTIAVLVPPGCTSLVQPLDVVFNGPFKKAVDELATTHMEANVSDYLHGNFTASERRILLTKWIGEAWEKVAANKDMVIRGFKKCGVSVAINGSEDNEINIKDLEDYEVESDDDDPFVSSESEDGSESDRSSDTCSSDDYTIVLSSESDDDDSQTFPKLTVPFDLITNQERFPPFAGGFINLLEVRDTPDEYFTI